MRARGEPRRAVWSAGKAWVLSTVLAGVVGCFYIPVPGEGDSVLHRVGLALDACNYDPNCNRADDGTPYCNPGYSFQAPQLGNPCVPFEDNGEVEGDGDGDGDNEPDPQPDMEVLLCNPSGQIQNEERDGCVDCPSFEEPASEVQCVCIDDYVRDPFSGDCVPNLPNTVVGQECNPDTGCGADQFCFSLFGPTSMVPSTCFATCDNVGQACSYTVQGFPSLPGVCAAFGGGQPAVCIGQAGPNGPCGNSITTTCTDANHALCAVGLLSDAPTNTGLCLGLCDPLDPSTCIAGSQAQGTSSCGCSGGDACSMDLPGAEESGEGFCTPATSGGETCGLITDPADGVPVLIGCTDGQSCSDPILEGQGTCTDP